MKRTYETPAAEKIAFCYQEQVAGSIDGENGSGCMMIWTNMSPIGGNGCQGSQIQVGVNN